MLMFKLVERLLIFLKAIRILMKRIKPKCRKQSPEERIQ